MIASVSLITKSGSSPINHQTVSKNKALFDLSAVAKTDLQSFDLAITFTQKISEFRNHDYTWQKLNGNHISNVFSPKIIRLSDGMLVQGNINSGIWEIQKADPKVLLWRFNPKDATPLSVYTGENNERIIRNANVNCDFVAQPALLFSNVNAIEFSRSSIPFSAITCFTDHCDFDTPESLVLQREFFKRTGVKVTKGFFLNHYSKREDNASFQNDAAELTQWKNDGHELAYHSLSQSIKEDAESFEDFYKFSPPFSDIPTWIDHGYQPYNFSLYQNNKISSSDFENNLKAKSITTLWNYVDSGTAATGVINQMNPNDFTLQAFYNGNKDLGFKQKIGLMIKNIMFHYYADEKIILKYKKTASGFKNLFHEKKPLAIFSLIKNFVGLAIPILKVFIFWKSAGNQPYKLAKYTPIIFRHTIEKEEFYIFQTLEMVDFKNALQPENIDKLIDECGIFIAHTYFSVPMDYHTGKMFRTPDVADEIVEKNFAYLGSKVNNRTIWNPTLNELVLFLANFEKSVCDVDANGNIIVMNASMPYRTVN